MYIRICFVDNTYSIIKSVFVLVQVKVVQEHMSVAVTRLLWARNPLDEMNYH